METKTVQTIRIFLASSNKLHDDRVAFADFIECLQNHYGSRNYSLLLDKWEYLDSSYKNKRKQSEYNELIKKCDIFVVLFHNTVGEYTLEEFNIAIEECRRRNLPLFIYFKDLKDQETPEDIKKIQIRIKNELEHFWGTYDTNDKLHLDFLLNFDNFLLGCNSNVESKKGEVLLEGVHVAQMSNLSFANANEDYLKMLQEIQGHQKKIEELKKCSEKYPNEQFFLDELQNELNQYNSLTQEFEILQKDLLATAKLIVDMKRNIDSEIIQKAMDLFYTGNLAGAKSLLQEITKDSELLKKEFENYRKQMHLFIDVFQIQAMLELADHKTPIAERIVRVEEIYSKADDLAKSSGYDKKKYADFLLNYASFLSDYALYDKAEKVYLRHIKLSEDIYKENDIKIAASYNNIGALYFDLFYYDKALYYYHRALDIIKKSLGDFNHTSATIYNNIGAAYSALSDFDKALENHKKSLEIFEKVSGKDNYYTASAIFNIGNVYYDMEKINDALANFSIAIDVIEKCLGEDSPVTADCYNRIGEAYLKLGNNGKVLEYDLCALGYLIKSLNVLKETMGPNHPKTAQSYNDLGAVYANHGGYEKAIEYYLKSLSIKEKALGSDSIDVALTYNNIGTAYCHQGKYDKALEYLNEAIRINERMPDVDTLNLATYYNNIATTFYGMGEPDNAMVYLLKAFDIRVKKLGINHPITIQNRKDIEFVKNASNDKE